MPLLRYLSMTVLCSTLAFPIVGLAQIAPDSPLALTTLRARNARLSLGATKPNLKTAPTQSLIAPAVAKRTLTWKIVRVFPLALALGHAQ